MYKFPVTKNGNEYGVSICQDLMYTAGFKVKLYEKFKLILFSVNICVEEELYNFGKDNEWYSDEIRNKTLYKTLTDSTICKYEKRTKKEDLLEQSKQAFNDWDGKL